jgi:hypothetical protein
MANVFSNKPFTEVLGKILDSNILLVSAYLPVMEFFNMLSAMNKLIALGVIKRYNYRLAYPLERSERQTIPYRNFADRSWIYEHDKYLERIHNLYKEVKKVNNDISSFFRSAL